MLGCPRCFVCVTGIGLVAILTLGCQASVPPTPAVALDDSSSVVEPPVTSLDASDLPLANDNLPANEPDQPTTPDTESTESASPAESATSTPATEETPLADTQPPETEAEKIENPFTQRIPTPDFPKGMQWLNTSGPLRKQDLQGKFVILDFWTYCCINCIHILPELKKLERAYPNELVVIGVHSAKFENEKDTKNIEEAILRYEIEHPVVNDLDHEIWNMFGVRSWPTVLLIDPEGNAIWGTGGEIEFETVDRLLKVAIPYYQQQGVLDRTPIHFDLLAHRQQPTPLRFPGKVLADATGQRLFITDSNNNRIVVASLDGKLMDVIGSGAIGREDGDFTRAAFDHPQGVALHGEILYVADTENHLLRKVDLRTKQVTTMAGIGIQRRGAWPGMESLEPGGTLPERFASPPGETALNSPWALWVHDEQLYIAMAGPHQIWKMPLDESEIGPFAGNGREDIVDGKLLPPTPYATGYSSFAQPSGLTSDGEWLFVADSEGSSIRAVPFDPSREVRTVVGTAHLPFGRLFQFGDVDGEKDEVRLQHSLGVAYHAGQIYVADTYNNKIKVVDAATGSTRTLAGTGEPGFADAPAQFDEPAGLSFANGTLYVADTNNHLIRTIDLATGNVGTLEVEGLTPPTPPEVVRRPDFSDAEQVMLAAAHVQPDNGMVRMRVEFELPDGWKINELAPASYWVIVAEGNGPIDRSAAGQQPLTQPAATFDLSLPVAGSGEEIVKVAMNYYYCQDDGGGLCKMGSVQWTVPLRVDDSGEASIMTLRHRVQ